MIRIRESLQNHFRERSEKLCVEDIRIGLGYTAIKLQNQQIGLANTFVEQAPQGCSKFNGKLCLRNPPAWEILQYLNYSDPISSALGLAACNALIHVEKESLRCGDIVEDLSLYPSDKLAMVGNFAPILSKLKQKAGRVYVFERISREERGLIPIEQGREIIPHCDVAFITSTSIINKTIDELLKLTQNCRDVVLLGASTPLAPQVFQNTPVTQLSGILVPDPEKILKIVSCGGGMQVFKNLIQKVNISVGV